jgi:hypothetical protein
VRQPEIRLIPISEEQVERLGEMVEQVIRERDEIEPTPLGPSVKADLLANDANLLASLAASYSEAMREKRWTIWRCPSPGCPGADHIEVEPATCHFNRHPRATHSEPIEMEELEVMAAFPTPKETP